MSALNKNDRTVKIAVIEGWHPFEVPQWIKLFNEMQDVDCYFQTIDNWAFDCAGCKDEYDVVLFYNMNMSMDDAPFKEKLSEAIEGLTQSKQGKIFLHHAILAYPKSSIWSDLVGIQDRSFDFHVEQRYTVRIACDQHPITAGLNDWSIQDETYTMADAGRDSEILLAADHAKSMKSIAWTRQINDARVFCFQCGHDHLAWENPDFKTVLHRGILWAANRI